MNTLEQGQVNLKIQLTDTAPCRKELKVEVPREEVEAQFHAVYRELRRAAHVPGFRVGNAPQDLLERYHGQKAREEVLHRLLSRSMEEALASQPTLDLVGRPEVAEIKLEPHQPFSYTARIELAPEVPLGRYRGLTLTRPKSEVADLGVGRALAQLQQGHAELKPMLEPRPAAAGDVLLVNIEEGSRKQRPALGEAPPRLPAAPAAQAGASAQREVTPPPDVAGKAGPASGGRPFGPTAGGGVILHLDLDRADGILRGLVGMQPGERRSIPLKDGLTAAVELKAIKVKEVPPLDDAFARTVGPYESLEALRQAVARDLEQRAGRLQHQALEGQALKQLVEEWAFDVPPSLVASQARRNLKQRAVELLQEGVPADKVEGAAQALTDQAKQDAQRQIRLFFILRRIAAEEKITAQPEEIQARLEALAGRLKTTAEQVAKDLKSKDLLDELGWSIVRGKVIDLLLQEAKIQEL